MLHEHFSVRSLQCACNHWFRTHCFKLFIGAVLFILIYYLFAVIDRWSDNEIFSHFYSHFISNYFMHPLPYYSEPKGLTIHAQMYQWALFFLQQSLRCSHFQLWFFPLSPLLPVCLMFSWPKKRFILFCVQFCSPLFVSVPFPDPSFLILFYDLCLNQKKRKENLHHSHGSIFSYFCCCVFIWQKSVHVTFLPFLTTKSLFPGSYNIWNYTPNKNLP